MEFLGYRRENGSWGIRNYVVVIPAANCANGLAVEIANGFDDVIALTHIGRCNYFGSDKETLRRVLVGLGSNPNAAAALVVGIGCEGVSAGEIASGIKQTGKFTEFVTIEEAGGFDQAVKKGREIIRKMLEVAFKARREPARLKDLVLSIKCGGSDSISGISGNIVVGKISDKVITGGGTVIFTETAEIIGAEHVLAKRAVNEKVVGEIYSFASQMERRISAVGIDIRGSQPTPANIRGGLTTIEEKSLGAVVKSGTSPIQGTLKWGEQPAEKGLFFMDGPSNTEVFPGCAAAGAQLLIYSLGGGLPAKMPMVPACSGGFPLIPIVKLTGNPKGYEKIKNNIDIYVGSVVQGEETAEEAAERALKEIIKIASGEKTTIMESLRGYMEQISFNVTGPLV
ncbi:UxaA family hydrolase [Candidatus Aerophobetes bacterium]|nr:UxaA family hydrolase [Candidatus Aerophobetes bacterium]